MKRLLLALTANAAALIAFFGIGAASWITNYEPELPESLKR